MRRVTVAVIAGAALLAGFTSAADAQGTPRSRSRERSDCRDGRVGRDGRRYGRDGRECPDDRNGRNAASRRHTLLGAPRFLFQPSAIVTNALSAPAGTSSRTDFLLRFTTVIPTWTRWLSLTAATQWAPNGAGGNNAPAFIYGAMISVVPARVTRGWLSISLDPIGVFGANNGSGIGGTFTGGADGTGAGSNAGNHVYKNYFYLEGAAVLNLGRMLTASDNRSALSGLAVHLLVQQQISGIPVRPDGTRDRWRPALVIGESIPLGNWRY